MVDLKEVKLKSNIKMAEEKKSFEDKVSDVLVKLGFKSKENEKIDNE